MHRRPELLLVCAGSAVSVAGTALTVIALSLALRPVGAFAVAGVFIAGSLPGFLLAPVAGLIVDRLPNRRLMIAAEIVQGAAIAGIAFLGRDLVLLFALLVLVGCGSAVARPAASALIPVITGEDGSTRGYAWNSTGNSIGLVLGTGLGGVLVAALGTRDALLVDAASYLIQSALLILVTAERRPGGPTEHTSALAGVRLLFGDRLLAVALLGVALNCLVMVIIDVAEVFFVTLVLHRGAIVVGLLQSMWMIGMLIGSRLAGRARSVRAMALGLCGAECLMGLMVGLPVLAPLVIVTALAYLAGGIGNAALNVWLTALVRARTPEPVRGRAFAAAGATINVAAVLGNVTAGLVLAVLGARPSFAVAAVATVVIGLGSLLATRRVPATISEQQRTARTV